MSDSFRLSTRAVAVSTTALLLSGAAFAPVFAGETKEGKGGKGGKGSASSRQGGTESAGAKGGSGESRGQSGQAPHGHGQGGHGGQGDQGGSGAKGTGGSGDPAGNNGTFKVDGLPWSDGMANEPHVTCAFRLKFFGFDDDQTGDITIAGHAPSGAGVVNKKTGVTISDDAAGGGPNDPDAIFTYTAADLDLSGLTAHPKQGYHLKVTLDTDTPGGVKHKVFWFEPCATETGGTGTGTDTETGGTDTVVGGTGGVVAPQTGTNARTEVLGTRFDRAGDRAGDVAGTSAEAARTGAGAKVLGTKFDRGGALAFTGSFTYGLLAVAGGLIALGGTLVLAARRRRVHPTA